MFCKHGAPLGGQCRACDIELLRQKAGEPGFFRACLGEEVAEAMASSKINDESTLQHASAVAAAIRKLS